MRELDLTAVELSGINLIEASAGTGKTYSIASLYLRMILEMNLLPEQILVVTYTEAATKELKGRIRSRLREAMELLLGSSGDDRFLAAYFHGKSDKERLHYHRQLDKALTLCDTAAIFTIHGFSLRALQDNAFESGALFEAELVTNQKNLLQEVVDDFWRSRFFGDTAPLLMPLLQQQSSIESLTAFAGRLLQQESVITRPALSKTAVEELEQLCQRHYTLLCQQWHQQRTIVEEIFTDTKSALSRDKSKGKYALEQIPGLLARMDAYCAAGNCYSLPDDFDHFTTNGIAGRLKKSGAIPVHPLFSLCQAIADAVAKRLLVLRAELVAYCNKEISRRKKERGIRFFDDLLTDLHRGLNGDSGAALAEALRRRYRAAMIDEFQDTDPLQYDIFRRIYGTSGQPLFLIGDPKQAIYSFRGADIFAYLAAVADTDPEKQFTLTGNWRSTPELLKAFNTLFQVPNPFLFTEIAYHEVHSGMGRQAAKPDNHQESAPLQLWLVPEGDDGKPLGVGDANMITAAAVAAEIARLTAAGRAPGEIAVIVRSHRQAGYIQDALRTLSLPSVARSDMSVFASNEAAQLLLLLRVFANPADETVLRTLLVSDLFGFNGDDLAELLLDDRKNRNYEELLAKFHHYHQLWLEKGFMAAMRLCMNETGMRGRLLNHADGERRLTDLLHCCELLHEAAQQSTAGVEGLIDWLGDRIARHETGEAFQIRLETDEQAVKILTIHISKGLEFPVVFVPYLWVGIRHDDDIISYHDGYRLVRDFGSPDFDSQRKHAQREALAEALRLLYVALTRARERCYLVAGKIVDKNGDRRKQSRPETSPLAYLLHADDATRSASDPVTALARHVTALSAEEMAAALREQKEKKCDAIAVLPMPTDNIPAIYRLTTEPAVLCCRTFDRPLASDWRVTSFTALAGHGSHESIKRDEPVHVELPGMLATADRHTIHTFPRGSQAGVCLHEIFEKLDFASHDAVARDELVATTLKKHGYDMQWQPVITQMIRDVVSTQLKTDTGSFSLDALKPGRWVSEMEFYLPLAFITSDRVSELFRSHAVASNIGLLAACADSLNFKPVQGMLRGFIDMICEHGGRYYLLDWKSNFLGPSAQHYGQKQLAQAMATNLYQLQYLLYSVALHRHLSLRFPGYSYQSNFGGIIYVFLRGVTAADGESYGFFRDRPPESLIEQLDRCLVATEGSRI